MNYFKTYFEPAYLEDITDYKKIGEKLSTLTEAIDAFKKIDWENETKRGGNIALQHTGETLNEFYAPCFSISREEDSVDCFIESYDFENFDLTFESKNQKFNLERISAETVIEAIEIIYSNNFKELSKLKDAPRNPIGKTQGYIERSLKEFRDREHQAMLKEIKREIAEENKKPSLFDKASNILYYILFGIVIAIILYRFLA